MTTIVNERGVMDQIDDGQVDAILKSPGGPHRIMDLCREGRLSPDMAADAIVRFENRPGQVFKRLLLAIFESLVKSA